MYHVEEYRLFGWNRLLPAFKTVRDAWDWATGHNLNKFRVVTPSGKLVRAE